MDRAFASNDPALVIELDRIPAHPFANPTADLCDEDHILLLVVVDPGSNPPIAYLLCISETAYIRLLRERQFPTGLEVYVAWRDAKDHPKRVFDFGHMMLIVVNDKTGDARIMDFYPDSRVVNDPGTQQRKRLTAEHVSKSFYESVANFSREGDEYSHHFYVKFETSQKYEEALIEAIDKGVSSPYSAVNFNCTHAIRELLNAAAKKTGKQEVNIPAHQNYSGAFNKIVSGIGRHEEMQRTMKKATDIHGNKVWDKRAVLDHLFMLSVDRWALGQIDRNNALDKFGEKALENLERLREQKYITGEEFKKRSEALNLEIKKARKEIAAWKEKNKWSPGDPVSDDSGKQREFIHKWVNP